MLHMNILFYTQLLTYNLPIIAIGLSIPSRGYNLHYPMDSEAQIRPEPGRFSYYIRPAHIPDIFTLYPTIL